MTKKIKKVGKKIAIGSVAVVSLPVFVGGVLGYFVGKYFAGDKTGQSGLLKSIILDIGNYRLHIHHWLMSLGILIIAFFDVFFSLPHVFFGLLGGMTIQGIYHYNDWRKVIIKK